MHKVIAALLLNTAILVAVSQPAKADFLLTLRLDPNVYTVTAGNQITLRGFFTTQDALTFIYDREFLFGLTSTSPHLGIVAGSVLSSTDFNPPVGGVSFQDIFDDGGYLGPTPITGPTVTASSDLRTFVIPTGTQAGTYDYSYGVELLPPPGSPPGTVLFDTSLRINVVPEPSTILLLATGLVGLLGHRRRRRQWTALATSWLHPGFPAETCARSRNGGWKRRVTTRLVTKALGLIIPPSLLARADEVIQ